MYSYFTPLQSSDGEVPDQAGDGGLPSTRSNVYASPVEDVQVADVFYEDTVSGSTVPTGPAAAPGLFRLCVCVYVCARVHVCEIQRSHANVSLM